MVGNIEFWQFACAILLYLVVGGVGCMVIGNRPSVRLYFVPVVIVMAFGFVLFIGPATIYKWVKTGETGKV